MTRIVRGASVEVELASGTFTVRWPTLGVALGPCRAEVTLAGATRSSTDAAVGGGAWHLEPREAFGQPGARAEWRPNAAGPRIALHVPIVAEATPKLPNTGFFVSSSGSW